MNAKINEKEKSSRLFELQQLQKGITLKRNRRLEGTEMEILVEGWSKRGGQLTGRTGTNKVVNFSGDSRNISELVRVRIKRASVNSLRGELL
jgi:tRNA-2-methylthio-N6-dimethylallyladenosine synthase